MRRGMKDRRYRRTEDRILTVFFDENEKDCTMSKMARKARVGRSTIYTHHHAMREIIPDYEDYILAEYSAIARRRLKTKNSSLRIIYLDMLIFVLRHKKIFKMFLKYGDRKILERMVGKLEGRLARYMRFPKRYKKIFRIYVNEIVGVIEEWGEKGFSEKEIEKLLNDVMYLTETAHDRLMPINHD